MKTTPNPEEIGRLSDLLGRLYLAVRDPGRRRQIDQFLLTVLDVLPKSSPDAAEQRLVIFQSALVDQLDGGFSASSILQGSVRSRHLERLRALIDLFSKRKNIGSIRYLADAFESDRDGITSLLDEVLADRTVPLQHYDRLFSLRGYLPQPLRAQIVTYLSRERLVGSLQDTNQFLNKVRIETPQETRGKINACVQAAAMRILARLTSRVTSLDPDELSQLWVSCAPVCLAETTKGPRGRHALRELQRLFDRCLQHCHRLEENMLAEHSVVRQIAQFCHQQALGLDLRGLSAAITPRLEVIARRIEEGAVELQPVSDALDRAESMLVVKDIISELSFITTHFSSAQEQRSWFRLRPYFNLLVNQAAVHDLALSRRLAEQVDRTFPAPRVRVITRVRRWLWERQITWRARRNRPRD